MDTQSDLIAIQTEQKRRASATSLVFNVTQTILKFGAALMTGSVSLLSEAIHSLTDIVASTLAFVSVRAAAAPPDEDHPYGHGKIESLAGFGESLLLLLIVVYIVVDAVRRLLSPSPIENIGLGMAVMAISTLGSLIMSVYVRNVGEKTKSMVLQSNGQHFVVDFWTSVGVLGALILTHFTGDQRIDSVVAILIALWMTFGAWKLSKEAFHQLIDHRLPEDELAKIEAFLAARTDIVSYHRLRTRLVGNIRHIDFHIVVPNDWSVVRAHDTADEVEKSLELEMAPAKVVIHVDPYDPDKASVEA